VALASAAPILKWAGGKSKQLPVIMEAIDRLHPDLIDTYYEPFLGGGAVFFELAKRRRFKSAVLSDTNAELIGMYTAVRDAPGDVIGALAKICARGFSEKVYYEIRASRPRAAATRAARMIYLNKLGYNGLYRVNKKGEFNVPWGNRKRATASTVYTEESILAASRALYGVRLFVQDYKIACREVRFNSQAFGYFDPPYVPVSASSDFTAYQADGFGAAEQRDLAYLFHSIAKFGEQWSGGRALLSNSHCPVTLKLYKGLVRRRIQARRSINSVGSKRGPVSELLVESRYTAYRK
jgi:DNA adenine methylase